MGDVGLCAIIRNEGRYLVEWLSYYRALGVDRFFIYNNDSTDDSVDVLKRMSRVANVTAIDWPHQDSVTPNVDFSELVQFLVSDDADQVADWYAVRWASPQITAYNHALANYGALCDWMIFVDADEFLNPLKDADIKEFLRRFDGNPLASAVAINEKYFGSAGAQTLSDEFVMERFPRCAAPRFDGHLHVKSVVRPRAVKRMIIHGAALREGSYVSDTGEPVDLDWFSRTPTISMYYAQINHYSVKSRQEFQIKLTRGRAHTSDDRSDKMVDLDHNYFLRQDRNEDVDRSILRFAERTKAVAMLANAPDTAG